MNRVQKLFVLGIFAANVVGCGGATPEIKPTTATPKVDQEKMKQNMEKNFEMMKNTKKGGSLKPPEVPADVK